jgi:hypothetical protein
LCVSEPTNLDDAPGPIPLTDRTAEIREVDDQERGQGLADGALHGREPRARRPHVEHTDRLGAGPIVCQRKDVEAREAGAVAGVADADCAEAILLARVGLHRAVVADIAHAVALEILLRPVFRGRAVVELVPHTIAVCIRDLAGQLFAAREPCEASSQPAAHALAAALARLTRAGVVRALVAFNIAGSIPPGNALGEDVLVEASYG